ncbi:hypothetical protein [Cyanobacterium sp. HL-69]|uniref:hypothetical protein n=1 Tax=Cyanobacterium sp. HL-69 TaxID=2054282 RepID=UPI00406BB47C
MDSYSDALATGAKPCKICCPKTSPINIDELENKADLSAKEVKQTTTEDKQETTSNPPAKPEETLDNSDTITPKQQDLFAQLSTDKQPEFSELTKEDGKTSEQSESSTKEDDKTSEVKDKKTKSKKKKKDKKPPAKKYKILAGNGCHQAISEVQGILVPPIDDESSYELILPDGLALEATFTRPYLESLVLKQPDILGVHWFRGYPKMQDNKLVAFQIVGWDGNMPTNEQGWERWEFIGLWALQKNLTVQRSIADRTVRKEARKTGFITEFKFTFSNTEDWVKQKKLWIGYVYKLLCRREGDTLKIQKVIPYACPRKKPIPKPQLVKKKASQKATKPTQHSQTHSEPQVEKEN